MSQITTHVLDTAKGKPAAGVAVILYHQNDNHWVEIAQGVTNKDGRVPFFLPEEIILELGVYKMKFEVQPYFETLAVKAFYPFVEIVFSVESSDHYHVPLLLNPFGYSTYRGS